MSNVKQDVRQIAIDGPAASGKGTLARRLAKRYGLRYLDTGLLYRAVGQTMLSHSADLDNESVAAQIAAGLDLSDLDNSAHVAQLRRHGISEAASRVAAYGKVRAALLDVQRRFASEAPGAVLDGRDIGTIVLPCTPVKLFVTATPEVRARRRFSDYVRDNARVTYEDVLRDIRIRDERDRGREHAPLAQAENAFLLDTTNLSIDAVFERAANYVDGAFCRDSCRRSP